jgi:hypothetical protein
VEESIRMHKSTLRRIFAPKKDDVAEGWRKLHDEELRNLYSSPNIVRMIGSRRMRWAGNVTCTREMRNACKILAGKPEEKIQSEEIGIDGSIILKWILGK